MILSQPETSVVFSVTLKNTGGKSNKMFFYGFSECL